MGECTFCWHAATRTVNGWSVCGHPACGDEAKHTQACDHCGQPRDTRRPDVGYRYADGEFECWECYELRYGQDAA